MQVLMQPLGNLLVAKRTLQLFGRGRLQAFEIPESCIPQTAKMQPPEPPDPKPRDGQQVLHDAP